VEIVIIFNNIIIIVRMKVIQYNIYFGDHPGTDIETRIAAICDCLNHHNVDVICLQEVLQNMFAFIVALLKDTYPHVFPNPKDGLDTLYGTVIFSKHPIVKTLNYKYEITSMGRDIKLIMIQGTEQKQQNDKIFICTTHFESEFNDGCMKKKYQYDRCSDILNQLYKKHNIPIILCSDTNICAKTENKFNSAFSYAGQGWKDAWIEAGSDPLSRYTFDSKSNPILIQRYKNPSLYRSRLDRILHLSNFDCVDCKLIGDNGNIMSDHYGILCTFSFQGDPLIQKDYESDFKKESNVSSIINKSSCNKLSNIYKCDRASSQVSYRASNLTHP
jgi:endonuclease/exonuclease/phosphatase family metal-dependent hydrolase